jgi:hypothetical protein
MLPDLKNAGNMLRACLPVRGRDREEVNRVFWSQLRNLDLYRES